MEEINVGQLEFNANLKVESKSITQLEPDLANAVEKIMWAEHLVWIQSVWCGGLTGIAKSFIDHLFMPGALIYTTAIACN